MLRYSLAIRIDQLFAELIEKSCEAQFSAQAERGPIITKAITKNDTLKFMLYSLFELRGIDEQKFLSLSTEIEEIGRMLYGWKNQAIRMEKEGRGNENRPSGQMSFPEGRK